MSVSEEVAQQRGSSLRLTHPFHWFIESLVHSFTDSLIHGFVVHWFIGSSNHSLNESCSLTHWFIDSLSHWSIDSLTHWIIDFKQIRHSARHGAGELLGHNTPDGNTCFLKQMGLSKTTVLARTKGGCPCNLAKDLASFRAPGPRALRDQRLKVHVLRSARLEVFPFHIALGCGSCPRNAPCFSQSVQPLECRNGDVKCSCLAMFRGILVYPAGLQCWQLLVLQETQVCLE